MKAQIIIELKGNFTEEDLKEDVEAYRREIENAFDGENEPKFNNFKVSYKILK